MNDHIDVFREVIECSNGTKIAGNDHLQQRVLEPRSPLCEILGLGLGSRGHYDRDPAFEQEVDDMGTQETCPSGNENAAGVFWKRVLAVRMSLHRVCVCVYTVVFSSIKPAVLGVWSGPDLPDQSSESSAIKLTVFDLKFDTALN